MPGCATLSAAALTSAAIRYSGRTGYHPSASGTATPRLINAGSAASAVRAAPTVRQAAGPRQPSVAPGRAATCRPFRVTSASQRGNSRRSVPAARSARASVPWRGVLRHRPDLPLQRLNFARTNLKDADARFALAHDDITCVECSLDTDFATTARRRWSSSRSSGTASK